MAPSTIHRPRSISLKVLIAALAAAAMLLAACGDDGGEETSSTAAPAPTDTAGDTAGDDAVDGDGAPAGTEENVAVATAVCEGYGSLDEEGIDGLLALMTDDVVLTDTVLGASVEGHEQVRGYLTSDAFDVDTAECGVAVAQGNWVAGTYTLSNSETGAGGEGIAAIHVTDGLVDQQVNYYTEVESGAEAPSSELVETSAVIDYCEAWDNGGDADAVLALMTPDAELTILAPLVGADAIGDYIENDFDFDSNDCQDVVVEHSGWVAGANRFANTETGAGAEGVQVIAVNDEGLITHHFGHMDASV